MLKNRINNLIVALEENHACIKEEFDTHTGSDDFETFTNGRSEGEWTTVGLKSVWGHWAKTGVNKYPTIYKLFSEHVPEVKAISINCLGPNASIGYHTGRIYQSVMWRRYLADKEFWANECLEEDHHIIPRPGKYFAYRFHYGLVVPDAPLLMGLECEGKVHRWENGKTFMFKDFERHRAWNDTNEKRYALIFDVLKKDYEGTEE
jgi:hypothetical protein